MRPPDRAARRAGQTPGLTSVIGRRYIDDVVDDYVSWREACVVVSAAYDDWKRAQPEDAKLAFSGCGSEVACALPSSQGRILGSIKFAEGGIGLDEDDRAMGAHQVKEHGIRLDVQR